MTETQEEKLKGYYDLLDMSYDEAVLTLLKKYGPATTDYTSEKSYNRMLNGEIASMSVKKKSSRVKEGIYCHHIAENIFQNLGKANFLRVQRPPYALQMRQYLVYADIWEHAILHALIGKETDGEFGLGGFFVFLEPTVSDWYVNHLIPEENSWQIKPYNKGFLPAQDAMKLILAMKSVALSAEAIANDNQKG